MLLDKTKGALVLKCTVSFFPTFDHVIHSIQSIILSFKCLQSNGSLINFGQSAMREYALVTFISLNYFCLNTLYFILYIRPLKLGLSLLIRRVHTKYFPHNS